MPRSLAGYTLTYYFFAGMLFFHWLEHIPRNWMFFIGACVLSYVFLYFNHTIYIAPVFVTYCTIFLGMLAVPKIKFIGSGDYSCMDLSLVPILQALMVSLSFPARSCAGYCRCRRRAYHSVCGMFLLVHVD